MNKKIIACVKREWSKSDMPSLFKPIVEAIDSDAGLTPDTDFRDSYKEFSFSEEHIRASKNRKLSYSANYQVGITNLIPDDVIRDKFVLPRHIIDRLRKKKVGDMLHVEQETPPRKKKAAPKPMWKTDTKVKPRYSMANLFDIKVEESRCDDLVFKFDEPSLNEGVFCET